MQGRQIRRRGLRIGPPAQLLQSLVRTRGSAGVLQRPRDRLPHPDRHLQLPRRGRGRGSRLRRHHRASAAPQHRGLQAHLRQHGETQPDRARRTGRDAPGRELGVDVHGRQRGLHAADAGCGGFGDYYGTGECGA